MPRPSRRRLLGALGTGLAAAVAGCVAGSPASSDPDATTTTTTERPATTTDDGPAGFQELEREVDYDHEVRLESAAGTAHTVEVRIEGAQVVYDERHDVAAGAERTLFDFSTLDDRDEQRSFRIRARFPGGEWVSERIEMDACHGKVVVTVTEEGELDVIYSIC